MAHTNGEGKLSDGIHRLNLCAEGEREDERNLFLLAKCRIAPTEDSERERGTLPMSEGHAGMDHSITMHAWVPLQHEFPFNQS